MLDLTNFNKYLTLLKNDTPVIKCLTDRDSRFVYMEKIDNEIYFIKKYIPQRKKRWTILFGLKRDYATHYKKISDKLKKLNIPHAEPIYIKSKIINFNKVSIFVTKYKGINLEKNLENFSYEDQVSFVRQFYNFYTTMYKNGIHVTDYNLEGLLVDEKKNIFLIDFDSYRLISKLTKKYKEHLKKEIKKAVQEAFLDKNLKINAVILEEIIKIQNMIDES